MFGSDDEADFEGLTLSPRGTSIRTPPGGGPLPEGGALAARSPSKITPLGPRLDVVSDQRCYLVFGLLGAGILMPWVCVITAIDYFELLFPGMHIEFYLPVAYMYPNLVFMLLVAFHGARYPLRLRVVGGYLFFVALMVLLPSLASIDTSTGVTLTITLLLVFLTGLVDAVVQGSVYGFAALFPARHMQSVGAGAGAAGVLVSLVRVFTRLGFEDNDRGIRQSSAVFFSVTCLFELACVAGFLWMLRNPYGREKLELVAVSSKRRGYTRMSMSAPAPGAEAEAAAGPDDDDVDDDDANPHMTPLSTSLYIVYLKVKPFAVAVWLNFFITLSLFPGVVAEIPSEKPSDDGWFPVLMIVTFNLCDFVGKTLPRFLVVVKPDKLLRPTLMRALFVPLFLLCTSGVIVSDGAVLFFIGVFAVTNGYLGALCMMYGPSATLVRDSEKESAGIVMAFSLILGLTSGATFSWLLRFIVV